MVNSCCAIGCSNRFVKGSAIGFHRFPSDEKRRVLWIHALRRKNWTPSSTSVVCGQHFQTGKPNHKEEHPDYLPNVFNFCKGKIRSTGSYEKCQKRLNRMLTAKNASGTPKENSIFAVSLVPENVLPGKAAHWTDINNPDWVPTQNIVSNSTDKLIETGVVKQEQPCIVNTAAKKLKVDSQETPDPISEEEESISPNFSRTEETAQDDELRSTSSPTSRPATEVPSKNRRFFLLCKRTSPKKTFITRSSTKAADVLIDEAENEKVKSEFEEIEHKLRVERLHRQIELVQKKIDVQNRLLEMLDKNPEKLNLKF